MVFDEVELEIVFERVGEKDVADASVCDGGTEDGDVIFVAPVVDAFFVVYLLS